ncbi:MAG: alcohol dehydrogenase catalytic domain-containing protein [Acidobacteria bacterium]|nr:alcohol dehydrogenase catalytic domain-containing protein [Acidobacteriota bacterium]
MKAARIHEPTGPVTIEETPVPVPGPGEVLLRTEACGLCHSDLFVRSFEALPKLPLTLGHEAVGVVERLGEGVEDASVGDRLGLTFLHDACGRCEACRQEHPELCPRQRYTGFHVDGGFAEYVIARPRYSARIPAKLTPVEAAPLCCAGWTAYHAVQEAALPPKSWLAVFGVGGLGQLAIQYARLKELRVAAVDVSDEKLDTAKSLGARIVVNSTKQDPVEALQRVGGVQAAVCFVGIPEVIERAVRCLRRGGLLLLVGLDHQKFELPIVDTVLNRIRIAGSFLGHPDELRDVMDIACRGEAAIQTQTCGLADLPDAMEEMKAGRLAGRVVVKFD